MQSVIALLSVVALTVFVVVLIYAGAHLMDVICDYFIPEKKD